jgi:N-acyl-D-aspartate/D-glutamate deacylase
VDVLARHRRGFVQVVSVFGTPEGNKELTEVIELCGERGIVSTTNVLAFVDANPDYSVMLMELSRRYRAAGNPFWPQMSPRTIDFRINWETSMVFMMLPPWHRIPNASDDGERLRLLRDPEWRAEARHSWDHDHSPMFPTAFLDRVRFNEVTRAENVSWLGKTLADLVTARGDHPSDVFADWVLENDLRPGITVVGLANSNVDEVAKLLVDPCTVVGSSDAGAHVQMMCAAGDTTLLLTRHVRERGDLSIEQAVHELTGKPADVFGFHERGRLEPGKAGDLTVFALDELRWDDDVFVDDLPGGSRRLRRPPGGYRYTIANGEVTQEDGSLTEARPGRVLHSSTG